MFHGVGGPRMRGGETLKETDDGDEAVPQNAGLSGARDDETF